MSQQFHEGSLPAGEQKERPLQKLTLEEFVEFGSKREGAKYEIIGEIFEEVLLLLHSELAVEVSIFQYENGRRLLIVGTAEHTAPRPRDAWLKQNDVKITLTLHSHTQNNHSEYPSGGDYGSYDPNFGVHAFVNKRGIGVYTLPEKYVDEDFRDVMIRNVRAKLKAQGSTVDVFDLLVGNYSQFMDIFMSDFPPEAFVVDPETVLRLLNAQPVST